MAPISICIVNLNCLQDTKELIWDLNRQSFSNFTVTLYDQNSTEKGTTEFYQSLRKNKYTVIQNGENKPLNHIWNEFAEKCETKYMSYLNNDIRITRNYIEDTIFVLAKDTRVGIVVHATNNRKFSSAQSPTKYTLDSSRIKQGWEFSIAKEHWAPIPKPLKFYCGDDIIFDNIQSKQLKVGIVTSSPVIHKLSRTRKNMSTGDAEVIRAQAFTDIETYKNLGYTHIFNNIPSQSRISPEMTALCEKTFDEVNLCKFTDYNIQLKAHLTESKNIDGIILDVGISDIATFNAMVDSTFTQGKQLIGIDNVDPTLDGVKAPASPTSIVPKIRKQAEQVKHAVDLKKLDSYTILDGVLDDNITGLDTPISFAFVGVFDVVKLHEILPKLWKNIQPGGTIFFPYYFSNNALAVRSYVDEFFEDKTDMILKSGLKSLDSNVAIKCFPTPMPVPARTKPLVVACVLKMNSVKATNKCEYNEKYVNLLASAVKRHATVDYEFVCLTDGDANLIDDDLVDRVIPLEYGLDGWWSKFELFRPEIFGDVQVLYFDLDTLITDNLDDIMNYGGKFLALHHFSTLASMASGILSWQPLYTNHVFYKFVAGMMSGNITTRQFRYGDQEAIGHLLELDIDWVQSMFFNKMRSFKYACYDGGRTTIPEGCSMVCFHGLPKMSDLTDDPVIQEHWR
jgi:hypothetical protein